MIETLLGLSGLSGLPRYSSCLYPNDRYRPAFFLLWPESYLTIHQKKYEKKMGYSVVLAQDFEVIIYRISMPWMINLITLNNSPNHT